MTLERRMAYWDPRYDATSMATSVVRPAGNPQQVVVTEVDSSAFYNQDRVDPRPALRNTTEPFLRPSPMYAHRWPDVGPYRGMTPQPFFWEQSQKDGLADITSGQRTRMQELVNRGDQLQRMLDEMRGATEDTQVYARLSIIQGQLDEARRAYSDALNLDDVELDMALDDMSFTLDQVVERLQALEGSRGDRAAWKGWVAPAIGVGLAAGFLWWASKRTP